jgi:ketol-acid reductoisomerase
MTTVYHDEDGDVGALKDQSVALVGYGNQGRSWALNLRDSGIDVRVCVRADASREQARRDDFDPTDIEAASHADVVCVLVPDDAIPGLPLERRDAGLTIVASGYSLAFGRFEPPGDLGMIAPRMLGPEVRRCYQEGHGFITALGIHRNATGRALERTLAVAKAIGGLRQGAIELTPKQEAVLDLAVEQVLSPALTHVNQAFVGAMLGQGIPLEAIMTELFLSGEVERNYRILREIGFARQMELHSPTSQYGQLSRRGQFDHLDFAPKMAELADDIASGRFADEWDDEARGGYKKLTELKAQHCGAAVMTLEDQIRKVLGLEARQGRE